MVFLISLSEIVLCFIKVGNVESLDLSGKRFLDDKGTEGGEGTEADGQRNSQKHQASLGYHPLGNAQDF